MADLPEGFVLENSAPPLPDGFHIEAADPTGPAAFNPAQGNNFAAGMGQGATDIGAGFEQLQAHNPLLAILQGRPDLAFSQDARKKVDQDVADKAAIDKELLKTTSGKLGSVAGQTAVLGLAPGLGAGGGLLKTAGNAALQGLEAGALQPEANADNFDANKLATMATGAGTGAATGGALYGLGALVNKIMPRNAAASVINRAGGDLGNSDFAKEGEQLAKETGVSLTPSQITGSKNQAKIENFARASPFGADKVFANDQQSAQQWINHINNTIDGIGQSTSTVDAGERVQGVIKNAVQDLTDKRSAQAAQDFGAVRAMTQGKAAIEPTNTAQALQDILAEHSGVGSDSSDALARFAKKQLANVAPEGTDVMSSNPVIAMLRKAAPEQQQALLSSLSQSDPAMFKQVQSALNPVAAPAEGNLDKIMKLRSYLSSVSGGQSKISGDPIDRKVAAQLLGTIDQDIDANASAIGGDLGGALKTANTNYRNASQAIDGIHEMALGKLLGEDHTTITGGTFNTIPGEDVYAKMLKMKPSQISMARGVLEQYSPETLQDVKATILSQALQKAQTSAPSAGARTLPANTGAYINALPDSDRLTALFKPNELADINRTVAVSRRLADRTGANFSGTTPMAELAAFFGAAPRALGGDPTAMGQMAAQVVAPKAIANIMANPDGRAIIQQMNRLPPGSQRFTQLSAQLAGLLGAQSENAVGASGQ